MSTSYYPYQSSIDYFKNNDRQFSFSDDELAKFMEIISRFIHKSKNNELDDIPEHSSLEVIEQRKSVCANCTHYNKDKDSCNLCGCIIENKVKNPSESCPIHFWGVDNIKFKDLLVLIAEEIDQFLKDNPDAISIEEYQRTFEPTPSETNE